MNTRPLLFFPGNDSSLTYTNYFAEILSGKKGTLQILGAEVQHRKKCQRLLKDLHAKIAPYLHWMIIPHQSTASYLRKYVGSPLVKVHHLRESVIDLMKRSRKRVEENLPKEDQDQGAVAPRHGRRRRRQSITDPLNHESINRGREAADLRVADRDLQVVVQDLEVVNHRLGAVNRGQAAGRERGKCPRTFERAEE